MGCACAIQRRIRLFVLQVSEELPAGVSRSKLHRGGDRIAAIRAILVERDGNLCRRCGVAIDLRLSGSHMYGPTIGHIVAASHGGTDYLDNLTLEHRRCNLRAGDRNPPRAAILQA